jgi:hypothetical protein
LYDHTQRANWFGGVWHNQLQYQPELDRRYSSHELHHQQLHGTEERNLDWHRNWHDVRGDRPFRFDLLQFHG